MDGWKKITPPRTMPTNWKKKKPIRSPVHPWVVAACANLACRACPAPWPCSGERGGPHPWTDRRRAWDGDGVICVLEQMNENKKRVGIVSAKERSALNGFKFNLLDRVNERLLNCLRYIKYHLTGWTTILDNWKFKGPSKRLTKRVDKTMTEGNWITYYSHKGENSYPHPPQTIP